MLVDAGFSHVCLGQSERRQYFADTDEGIAKKRARAAFRRPSARASRPARVPRGPRRPSLHLVRDLARHHGGPPAIAAGPRSRARRSPPGVLRYLQRHALAGA
jgi:hypothetical protein